MGVVHQDMENSLNAGCIDKVLEVCGSLDNCGRVKSFLLQVKETLEKDKERYFEFEMLMQAICDKRLELETAVINLESLLVPYNDLLELCKEIISEHFSLKGSLKITFKETYKFLIRTEALLQSDRQSLTSLFGILKRANALAKSPSELYHEITMIVGKNDQLRNHFQQFLPCFKFDTSHFHPLPDRKPEASKNCVKNLDKNCMEKLSPEGMCNEVKNCTESLSSDERLHRDENCTKNLSPKRTMNEDNNDIEKSTIELSMGNVYKRQRISAFTSDKIFLECDQKDSIGMGRSNISPSYIYSEPRVNVTSMSKDEPELACLNNVVKLQKKEGNYSNRKLSSHEQKLFKLEDARFHFDILLKRVESTICRIKEFLKNTELRKSCFVEEHLQGCHLRIIGHLYKDSGEMLVKKIRENVESATRILQVVLPRLEKKITELYECSDDLQSLWNDIGAEIYYGDREKLII